MKKWMSFVTALLLLLTTVSAFASADTLIYASDFTAGVDEWYGRGDARVYRTTEATLKTEGRSADWNSPGRYFNLVAGNEYEMSVDVLQNDADVATLMVSMERTDVAGTGWDNLVSGSVKKGEWTTLRTKFTPGDYDTYVLYVETTGNPQLSYEIKNFRLESPNGIPAPKVTEAPAQIVAVEDIPSLKELYAGKFDIGSAVPQYVLRGKNKAQDLILAQYNILTPENEMKPDSVLDIAGSRRLVRENGDETAVAVHFDAAKALLDFAQANGLKVHGHVLVWHAQTPEAFFHEGYDAAKPVVSREVMLGRLENYIKEVLTKSEELYPGVIVSWDVVNEAIDDGTNWLRKTSNWTKVIGEDFINKAFEFARKYAAEGVKLYYNDYNTAYTGKLNGIIKLLEMLIPEGNIDGYGFQMHHSSGEPSDKAITTAVEKIAALGIKLRVSELDVGITKFTEQALEAQKTRYKFVMELMLRFAEQTEAVQVWGLTDNMSWRSASFPLPFDADMNPKPAFFGMVEAVGE